MSSNRPFLEQMLDYVETLKPDAQKQLVEFLECKPQTLRSWLRRKTTPSGVRVLRMNYLMNEVGVHDPHWRCKDKAVQDVGRLVAFHVISIDDIVARFDNPGMDASRVLQFLIGHKSPKAAFQAVFEDISNEFSWDVTSAKHKWSHLCMKDEASQKIAALAAKIVDILPDASDMVSDNWTAEERQELRKRCGPDTVFQLYNVLGALCGEQARKHQMKSSMAGLCVRRGGRRRQN